MNIDLAAFTPVASAIGGVLIGTAAALLLLANGRIAGVSGIAGGLFTSSAQDRQWRLAFLIGLVLSPLFYALVAMSGIFSGVDPSKAHVVIDASIAQLALAGLVVGIGTGLASGCTSGHGVCGIARLSPRSLVATSVFMATAIIVVFIARHVLTH
jgi:uncharacterized membrane protein YedE/YeeE